MNKFCLALFICFSCCAAFAQNISVYDLKCEDKIAPLNIDAVQPKFSWKMKGNRGCSQTAYQILVSKNKNNLQKGIGEIWNSEKITSTENIFITYNGKTLQAATTYFWCVKTWNVQQQASAWSAPSSFTTGLFTNEDWSNAKWIGYEDLPDTSRIVPGVHSPDVKKKLGPDKAKARTIVPLFRKTFSANKTIINALAFISGLGHYELNINGQKVGNSFLAPGWTSYDKRCLYNSYDISSLIKKGQNAIGVIVGNGFYNINRERYFKEISVYGNPTMICKIQLTYSDGSVQNIVSDDSWKTAPSPITFSSIYGGEDCDATLEQKGWNTASFSDAAWKNAILVKSPKGTLEAEKDYPVQVCETFSKPVISQPAKGVYMYDFGQNISGIVELKVSGKKGQTVKLTPAELITDDSLANQKATGKPYYFSYTLKGDGVETWRPRFTYYGFRYVQVEGGVPANGKQQSDLPSIISLASLHTRNSSPTAGSFECSNQLFNQINTLIRWAIKSNLQSVITDCPHREKLSWLEQDYLMGDGIKSNFETYNLYRKLIYDMMDAQTAEGLVPDIAPEFVFFDDHGFGFRDSPEWGSAAVIVPWLIYKWYGDKDILATAYPMMQKYADYLQSRASNHILSYGLGDWYDYGPNHPGVAQLTPIPLTATAIYYYDLSLMNKVAALLGNTTDADKYSNLSQRVKQAFNDKFFNVATNVYATGSQTSMAMPLCVGLVNEENKPAVMKNLVDSITASGKKLTAGDVGYNFLVRALHEGNASQLIYEMNNRDDVAGYGFQIKKGATALTESWQALKDVSNNHLMLGHIMQWFYNGLLGINQADSSVGYKRIVIKPEIVGDVHFAKGSYETMYGTIVSDWKKENGAFLLHVVIPGNTTATVYLPATAQSSIYESNQLLSKQKDIKILGNGNGRTAVNIGSGEYWFTVKN